MSDFCYDRPMLNRIFRQADLMDRVMAHAHLDAAAAVRLDRGMAWYEARSKCIACDHERQCRLWLERNDLAPESPPQCPNADFFRRCAGAHRIAA